MTTDESAPQLLGYRTTFHQMFSVSEEAGPRVEAVEIPLIQRDYAQGRRDPKADAVRSTFLDALHAALTSDTSAGLDFIYGEVADGGSFEPLDGQQRLTTLFLLHWYVAARRDSLDASEGWTRFSYATRPSARRFCERIVENPPPAELAGAPSHWIRDQSWFLHLWTSDPSVSAMLVTLDAIAERFATEDAVRLWSRLTDLEDPAIWFQLLPINEMGAADDLYIKMNSRGKPLTEFESFKALLGQLVEDLGGFDDFGHRMDGAWTDLLWPYRGENNVVDDEFMRYFDFLMEVCEWREGRPGGSGLTPSEKRIRVLLGRGNSRADEHLQFMAHAFDCWVDGEDAIESFFDATFTTTTVDGERLRLFGANATSDLLEACWERYGDTSGTTRLFSLTDTLLLFAVLVHMRHGTDDVQRRLRVLRNVNEASQFELRLSNMPKFIVEVDRFVRTGDLASLATFNNNQVAEERWKRDLLTGNRALEVTVARLEDHSILRGSLTAFDLDEMLGSRGTIFEAAFEPTLWPLLTGALLATGEYQRAHPYSDQFRLGSPTTDSVWRLVLVDRGDRTVLAPAREALMTLLDRVGSSATETLAALEHISSDFVAEREERGFYDWRYYLVRYPEMREGNSGIYFGAERELGYQMTMLRRKVQSSYFRDAYLYAIWSQSGRPDSVEDPWFFGYSTTPRWMKTVSCHVGQRSMPTGIAVDAPDSWEFDTFASLEGLTPTDSGWLLTVPQEEHDGQLVDAVDRVQLAAAFLGRLLSAGF